MGKKKFNAFCAIHEPETQLTHTQANKMIRCYLADKEFELSVVDRLDTPEPEERELYDCYKTFNNTIPIGQYGKDGKFIRAFSSAKNASIELNINEYSIVSSCNEISTNKTAGGYQWRRLESIEDIADIEPVESINSIPVKQYTLEGEFVKEYPSVSLAASASNTSDTNIFNVLSGRQKTTEGFQWCKTGEEDTIENLTEKIFAWRKVKQYDKFGKFCAEFKNAKEASIATRINSGNIISCCRKLTKIAGDFQWCFADENLDGEMVRYDCHKQISQFSLDGKFIMTYPNITEAERILGIENSNIYSVCSRKPIKKSNGKIQILKSSNGYQWCFVGDEKNIGVYTNGSGGWNRKIVSKYSLDGDYIDTYESASIAMRTNNLMKASSIIAACMGKVIKTGGFQWRYGDSKENIGVIKKRNTEPRNSRIISQYTLDGDYVKTYPTIRSASIALGIGKNSAISKVIRGNNGTCYGFQWRYGDSKENIGKVIRSYNGFSDKKRPINQYTLDGTFIKSFESICAAEKEYDYGNSSGLNKCLKRNKNKYFGGYQWCFVGQDDLISKQPQELEIFEWIP